MRSENDNEKERRGDVSRQRHSTTEKRRKEKNFVLLIRKHFAVDKCLAQGQIGENPCFIVVWFVFAGFVQLLCITVASGRNKNDAAAVESII